MKVFRGQKTEAVTSLLHDQKILNEYVPNNMTNYFQVLDLTVNKWVKDFMEKKFNEWFATQLRNELEHGKELENVTIKFLLSAVRPLHAGWLIQSVLQSVHFITRKRNYFSRLESIRNICCCRRWLNRFSYRSI